MSLGISPHHLRRYRDIAWLLWKHGRSDWVESIGLDKTLEQDFKSDPEGPESFARDLESLGPTFVKVGQLLSSRADLLPPAYLVALRRLQDDVAPVAFDEIETAIVRELDAPLDEVFGEIDRTPLAAASLAQVHAARLRDGREVVVKVQRPNARERVRVDFEAFAAIARLAAQTAIGRRFRVEELVQEFRQAVEDELDYRREADNLVTVGDNLKEYSLLRVPRPVMEFSTRRVLTMQRLHGVSVASVPEEAIAEVEGAALAEEVFSAYLKQILIDGIFHADPHPGNVLFTRDGRLGLVDLGLVGRVDSDLQRNMLSLLIAVSEGRGRETAEAAIRIGETSKHFDRSVFVERVTELVLRNHRVTVSKLEAGRIVLRIQQIAAEAGIRLPRALALVGKALLNLDAVGRCLAPDFDPNAAIRRHTLDLIRQRMRRRLSPGNLVQSTLEMSELAAQLPRRLNELLAQMGESGIRLDVETINERTLIDGFQKVANRITTGLVLAALIIGAALIMDIETTFTLFGYPGLAIVLFVAAALGGLILLYQMIVVDHRRQDDDQ